MNETIDIIEPEAESRPGRRSARHFILLGMALLLGAGGVFLAQKFIDAKIDYYRRQAEKTEPMVQVVVPARDMVRGEVVTLKDMLKRDVPTSFAHINAVTPRDFDRAAGQRLSFDIARGKPLLWAHLEGGRAPTFSGKLEEGKRALTVPVDEINSISGFLQPTDNIDLFMTYQKQVMPIVQNLHVLATGSRTMRDKSGQATGVYQTITVEVTPEIAKKITLARSVGKITATLRNPQDQDPISKRPYTVRELLNRPRVVRRQVKKRGIEYIIGGAGA
ncbi:MAG TPA: Flp pilus assembly protein CpaB [Gammaproteobacteria bacterium]|nr:Flp pilus assembly protein CpaB [Gammaproteobacteria bacterium]